MDNQEFLPFYERAAGFPGYGIGQFLVSALLAIVFLAAHYMSIGNKVFQDWSWLLAALIATAMLCLYYASHTLHALLAEMGMRLRADGPALYRDTVKRTLSDRNFLLAGLFFGLLNCAFGLFFGIPYSETLASATILAGYFLAGFVCGMAVLGIYGVSVSIAAFAPKLKHSFDFTSPDGCGGTQFLGETLVIFSSVTLIVGVMISVYLLKADWTRNDAGWIGALKYFWIVFPYLMSLTVLIAPAVAINTELREYKLRQEGIIQDKLNRIRERLEKKQLDPTERKELREDYEFQQGVRKDLHGMRTWPYGFGANLTYLGVFVASLFASVDSALSWIDKLEKLK